MQRSFSHSNILLIPLPSRRTWPRPDAIGMVNAASVVTRKGLEILSKPPPA